MSILTITIVEAALVDEANEKFRVWREEHPAFMEIATDDSIIVEHIRGSGANGKVVAKSRYLAVVDHSVAETLAATRDLLLDVVVVEAKEPGEADREFEAWWRQRPSLQNLLGRDGYQFYDLTPYSPPRRQYRIRLQQRHAALLAPG
jgi:hypothetical protein